MDLARSLIIAVIVSVALIVALHFLYRGTKPNAIGVGCLAACLIMGAIFLVIAL